MILFHDYIPHNGEQPEEGILAHISEEPTAGCITYIAAS